MRAMFVASPLLGHVLPLLPLATAFRDAGHDVVLATAAEGVAAAEQQGVRARDVAPGLDLRRTFLRPLVRHPLPILRMLRGDEGTDGVGLLFAALTERLADGTIRLAEDWRPDLVLHEGLAAVGAVVAAKRGIPGVLVDSLIFDGWDLFRAVARNAGRTARRHGLDELPEPADAVATIPRSLAGERRGRPMRYLPATATGEVPDPLRHPVRPTVLVSRSTADDPRPDRMMTRVVEAAAGADVEVVLVRPDRWVRRRPLPANVTAVDWLPFGAVFPHVAGVVHHGGAGTVMTALAAGLPQIVVPGAGDRTRHARLVAERGAGLAVPLDEMSAGALERLVSDPALATAAGEVAEEIAAMPHPAELVDDLVAVAR